MKKKPILPNFSYYLDIQNNSFKFDICRIEINICSLLK